MYTEEYILANKKTLDLPTVLKSIELSESALEQLLFHVNFNTILCTQRLSIDFIVKYLLNPEYQEEDSETTISYADILYYQGYTEQQIRAQLEK